ncbi:MAG: hypothetical protein ACE5EX_08545 [Phycisphaerae bacterium]
MSEKKDLRGKPTRSNVRWGLAVVGLLVLVAALVIGRGVRVDDPTLERSLAGTWTAVDPNNAALHRREVAVAREQLVFRANGTLTHVVELASAPGKPDHDPWGWRVRKGRLYVRFLGEDAGGQWLPGIAFSVSDTALSIRIKGHPPKEWVRG